MQTFDFKTRQKQVQALERRFKKTHDALDEIALPITVRGEIDTLLHKQQVDMTNDIMTVKVSEPVVNVDEANDTSL